MNLHEAPAFVAVKVATLSDGCATATVKADQLTAQIADLRDRFNGRVIRTGDHPEKLRIDIQQRLEEQKALQRQRPIEADILGRCRAWLAGLPRGAVLEQIIPDTETGLSLSDVRVRIKKLQNQVEALKGVPIPASDIRVKVGLRTWPDAADPWRHWCGRKAHGAVAIGYARTNGFSSAGCAG